MEQAETRTWGPHSAWTKAYTEISRAWSHGANQYALALGLSASSLDAEEVAAAGLFKLVGTTRCETGE